MLENEMVKKMVYLSLQNKFCTKILFLAGNERKHTHTNAVAIKS